MMVLLVVVLLQRYDSTTYYCSTSSYSTLPLAGAATTFILGVRLRVYYMFKLSNGPRPARGTSSQGNCIRLDPPHTYTSVPLAGIRLGMTGYRRLDP